MVAVNLTDVTIANGASQSSECELRGQGVVRVWVPPTFDGSIITFLGARRGGPFAMLCDEFGDELQLPVAAGRCYMIPPEWTLGCEKLIVRAGVDATPTNQTGETVIGLSFRPFA